MHTCGEATCTLLIASGLPCYLWAEAMAHACWIQNQTPMQALDGKTLYEMMTGRKPNLTGIQRFGAVAYVKLENAGKLKKEHQKAVLSDMTTNRRVTEYIGQKNMRYL